MNGVAYTMRDNVVISYNFLRDAFHIALRLPSICQALSKVQPNSKLNGSNNLNKVAFSS